MPQGMLNRVAVAILGAASGAYATIGLVALFKYYSKIDSVRDAVYAHADKITPEIIEQADKLVSEVSAGNLYTAVAGLGLAGATGASAYFYARRQKD